MGKYEVDLIEINIDAIKTKKGLPFQMGQY